MASTCNACGTENTQDSNFCRMCGAKVGVVEIGMSWEEVAQHHGAGSRTPSPASHHSLERLQPDDDADKASTNSYPGGRGGLSPPSSPRLCGMERSRNSNSYHLLLRLQAAGAEWRSVDASPEVSPKMPKRGDLYGDEAAEGKADQILPSQKRWGPERERFLTITRVPQTPSFPRILCVARRYLRKNKYVDITGEYHLELIQQYGGVPIILPRTTRTVDQLTEYLPMDGLVIAEGNDLSDDILTKYGCHLPERLEGEAALKWAGDTELDVSKDELEFALMRFALAAGVPILTFCRGSQMLNCLRGGTLIGDITEMTDSRIEHLRDSSDPTYDSFRHPIAVEPKTPLAEWFGDSLQDGSNELLVNSYHHQASKTLGSNLVAMAHAPDGIIEGFYDPSYDPKSGRFVVGLQFHPERMLQDYPGCPRCYDSFLEACRAYKAEQDCSA